jgi:hypothetical protein
MLILFKEVIFIYCVTAIKYTYTLWKNLDFLNLAGSRMSATKGLKWLIYFRKLGLHK